MNRQQAAHILDAYVRMRMRENDEYDEDASDALREVILDAMTEYKSISNPWTITYPPKPLVTYTPKITCTGVDPAFRANTAEVVG